LLKVPAPEEPEDFVVFWRELFDTARQAPVEPVMREVADFHSQHRVTLPCQPDHIPALAAQRHEHVLSVGQPQLLPELPQMRIIAFLVESDFVLTPAAMPEIQVHTTLPGLLAVRFGLSDQIPELSINTPEKSRPGALTTRLYPEVRCQWRTRLN
jgi:hypothetical protein